MPTVTKYSYTLSADVPQGVSVGNLENEINAPDSGITIQVDHIDATPTTLDIYMKDVLSAGEKTVLDGDTTAPAGGLLAAHDPTPVDEPTEVTLADGPKGPSGEIRVYDPPNRPSFYRCDRDIRLRTAKITDSFADKGQNLTTLKQEDWNEVSLVGVYKDDGAGNMIACTDDGDAALNAILSVWDFVPHDHSDPDPANCQAISIDLLGGQLYVDPILEAPTDGHVFYAVAMPDEAVALGGKIPFFDAYLDRSSMIESLNFKTIAMDPVSPIDGSYAPGRVTLRFYLHYPQAKQQEHTLQIVMFRPLGTWSNS